MKRLKLAAAVLAMIVLFSMTAFAKEDPSYRIYSPCWDDASGLFYADWEECDVRTSYHVMLYKDGVEQKNIVKSVTASKGRIDLTEYIVKKGRGSYVYRVYPVKGGEQYTIQSDVLEVDAEALANAKKILTEMGRDEPHVPVTPVGPAGPGGGQVKEPDHGWVSVSGKWKYKFDANTIAKDQWLLDNGHWYYFGGDGLMKTGWQYINGKWYYLTVKTGPGGIPGHPEGSCFMNEITPDGCTVNASGELVINGVVVTDANRSIKNNAVVPYIADAKTKGTGSTGPRTVSDVRVNFNEKAVDGGCAIVDVSGVNGATLTGWTVSKPAEKWTTGDEITFTVKVSAPEGRTFDSKTKFTTAKGTLQSASGNAAARVIIITYRPDYKLQTPTGFYTNESGEIRWDPVKRATFYRVETFADSSRVYQEDVYSEYCNVPAEYYEATDEGKRVSMRITAMYDGENKRYKNSDGGEIQDLKEFLSSKMIHGTLEYEDSGLRYYDEYGNQVTGWIELAGSWYHFRKNGLAEKAGWFQDTDGKWYWFNDGHRMVTGWITDNGTKYFLNDGSVGGVPLGAWVEGK